MTSENELKVGGVLSKLNHLIFYHDRNHGETNEGSEICNNAINLIKSQQSRIEVLESAIREFLEISKTHYPDDLAYILSKQTLEILMGNE